jgi:hypothetical protein
MSVKIIGTSSPLKSSSTSSHLCRILASLHKPTRASPPPPPHGPNWILDIPRGPPHEEPWTAKGKRRLLPLGHKHECSREEREEEVAVKADCQEASQQQVVVQGQGRRHVHHFLQFSLQSTRKLVIPFPLVETTIREICRFFPVCSL